MPPVTPDHKMHVNFAFGSRGQGLKTGMHNWYEHGGLKDLLNSPMYMPGIIKESPRHPAGRDLQGTDQRLSQHYNPNPGNVSITLNYNDFRPAHTQLPNQA